MRILLTFVACVVAFPAIGNRTTVENSAFESDLAREEYRLHLRSAKFGKDDLLEAGAKPENKLRLSAMRDTALQLGAQAALFVEADKIRSYLYSMSGVLDRATDMSRLMLRDPSGRTIRPPVIEEGGQSAKLESSETVLRVASATYSITVPAGFTLQVPTWKEYLVSYERKPDLPSKALLPRDADEDEFWAKWFDEGWSAGIQQARRIYQLNVNRLTRDYVGMVRYHLLRHKGYVTDPVVSTDYLGVTGDSERMALEDVLLTINVRPGLNLDTSQWSAVPRLPNVQWLNVPYEVDRPDLDPRITINAERYGEGR